MDGEIKTEFEGSGFSFEQEETILQNCLTYCINYQLSPADLVSHWEVYYLNRQLNGLIIEVSEMEGFLSHLQKEVKEKAIKDEPHLHIYSSNDVDMLLNGEHEVSQEDAVNASSSELFMEHDNTVMTPSTSDKFSSAKASRQRITPITPFGQRTTKFAPLITINAEQDLDNGPKDQNLIIDDDNIISRVGPNERCSLSVHQMKPEPGCRFMYDRIEDKFNFLENRIKKHMAEYAACGLYGEPTVATVASQKSIFTVGMVSSDGQGRLNEKSILLTGSAEHSGGESVRVDLQKVDQFSLYPGEVVGIEGHNPSGHCLVALNVVDCLPLISNEDTRPLKKQAIDQERQPDFASTTAGVLSVVVAAGPFTTTDNLLYEPLADLLAYARRKQPQLLILVGPFIDSEHPEIKRGTVDRTFEDIFSLEILRKLMDYTEYMGPASRVIIVPSIRDASHDYVFPQPPFDIHSSLINDQITCLANPTTFSANEIMFGCCSVDVLKHLSSEEVSRMPANASNMDRIGRLAAHLLHQRSFYPLYPPAVAVPFDFSLAPEALDIPRIPDVMLLPSDLAPFIKVLKVGPENEVNEQAHCICINPGRLAKGIGGGTFVEVNYNNKPDMTKASVIRI